LRVWAYCVKSLETWISGAPPPAINALRVSGALVGNGT
jgi:hypothetical protein